ncbi:MAG TPA: response regulator transcription factor [Anaerolineae bacterium]|nr:response regulator transcription factor [Anaerolineae bacterium]
MKDNRTHQEAKACILVLSDEPYSLDLIKLSLTTDGFDVETASIGDDALSVFEEHAIGLILLDIMTTEDAAIEVMSRLRSGRSSIPPMILLSALGEKAAKKTGKRLGAVRSMMKPVTRGDLLDAVDMAVNRS